jgi:hypothetical protein
MDGVAVATFLGAWFVEAAELVHAALAAAAMSAAAASARVCMFI